MFQRTLMQGKLRILSFHKEIVSWYFVRTVNGFIFKVFKKIKMREKEYICDDVFQNFEKDVYLVNFNQSLTFIKGAFMQWDLPQISIYCFKN